MFQSGGYESVVVTMGGSSEGTQDDDGALAAMEGCSNNMDFEASKLFEQDRATNDKMLVDSTWGRMVTGHDATLNNAANLFANVLGQNQQLFAQMMAERQQLFAATLPVMARAAHNGVTIDGKNLDLDTNEINSQGIGAKVVQDISPAIATAVEAAVAKTVNATGVSTDAIAAAVAAAVVGALSKGVVTED